jgi:uncharacterized protein with GYD domain
VALYLGRFKYTAEATKAMIDNPHDRGAVAAQTAESLGCKLQGIWWTLGEYDGAFIVEAPDTTTVIALSMAVGASGQISSHATELIDMDQAQQAMRRAGEANFRAPR